MSEEEKDAVARPRSPRGGFPAALLLAVLALGVAVAGLLRDYLGWPVAPAPAEPEPPFASIQVELGELALLLAALEERQAAMAEALSELQDGRQAMRERALTTEERLSDLLERLTTINREAAVKDRELLLSAGDLARSEAREATEQLRRQFEDSLATVHPDLAEAEYLLRTALYLLHQLRDLEGARQALRQANALLLAGDFSGAALVGRELREILQQLEAMDTGGAQRAGGLLTELRTLLHELRPASWVLQQRQAANGADEASSPWWRNWYRQYLAPQFRYQRADAPPLQLADGEQLALARRRMELALDFADHALLRLDAAEYRRALQTLAALAAEHFALEDEAGRKLLATLQQAESQDIAPALPDLEPLVLAVARLRQAD